MIYRVSFIFEGMGVGWSETHALKASSDDPVLQWPASANVASKRVQMLGREFRIKAVRVSRYSTDAGVRIRGFGLLKQDFSNAVQTATGAAEPSNVALLVDGYSLANPLLPQFDANVNKTFLGAPLDVSVDNAGIVFEGKGGLGAAFAGWREALLAGQWGWLANDTVVNAGITTIAQNLNGSVKLTMDVADIAVLVIGQVYKARCRDVNQGRSPMNIELVVRKTSATELVTQRVIGIPTPQTGGSIRVYKQVQPFVEFEELKLQGQVGKHKRGRPIGTSPGRAPARILG